MKHLHIYLVALRNFASPDKNSGRETIKFNGLRFSVRSSRSLWKQCLKMGYRDIQIRSREHEYYRITGELFMHPSANASNVRLRMHLRI